MGTVIKYSKIHQIQQIFINVKNSVFYRIQLASLRVQHQSDRMLPELIHLMLNDGGDGCSEHIKGLATICVPKYLGHLCLVELTKHKCIDIRFRIYVPNMNCIFLMSTQAESLNKPIQLRKSSSR